MFSLQPDSAMDSIMDNNFSSGSFTQQLYNEFSLIMSSFKTPIPLKEKYVKIVDSVVIF